VDKARVVALGFARSNRAPCLELAGIDKRSGPFQPVQFFPPAIAQIIPYRATICVSGVWLAEICVWSWPRGEALFGSLTCTFVETRPEAMTSTADRVSPPALRQPPFVVSSISRA
jgi:hypothetical protein